MNPDNEIESGFNFLPTFFCISHIRIAAEEAECSREKLLDYALHNSIPAATQGSNGFIFEKSHHAAKRLNLQNYE